MASNHRKSRKQFRTPLGRWIGDAGKLPKRRFAQCPDVEEPFPGKALRGRPFKTGLVAVPRQRRSRVASCPEVEEPFRGRARRGRVVPPPIPGTPGGLPRRRRPAPEVEEPFKGRAARSRPHATGLTPVKAKRSYRLPAGRVNSFRLPARKDAAIRLSGSPVMSISSNLTFFRGEDVVLDFTLAPPEDVTGWTIGWKMATTLGGAVHLNKAASITDGPRGQFRVTIASADTASLPVGRYVWDARRTDSGSKATLADGYVDLRQEVTA
jgi:hypothetical protein